jgi:hypothetical protein
MRALFHSVAAAALLAAKAVHGEPTGKWTATSTTATAVTGDIILHGDTLVFGNGRTLQLKRVESRDGRWTPLPETRRGTIYKLAPPSDPALLDGNTLCGKRVTYIVLSQRAESRLSMTAFTGEVAPHGFGADACAVFFYER